MGIKFFKKNKMDLEFTGASIIATDGIATDNGQAFVNYLRNRDNTSGWITTGSTDAGNTTLEANMCSGKDINRIILVKHNFKAFTIQYWNTNTLLWTNFSPAISATVNTIDTTIYSFTSVNTTKIRLIVTGTFVANTDKRMTQLIMTELIGELITQPIIQPKIDRSRKVTKFLSGKVFVTRSVPSFEVKIKMNNVTSNSDLTLVETLFSSFESFLVWLSGGDITQYDSVRVGYRLEDLYLVNVDGEYMPAYEDGRYKFGVPINLGLQETN